MLVLKSEFTGEKAAKGEHDKSLRGGRFIQDLYVYTVVERWLGGEEHWQLLQVTWV